MRVLIAIDSFKGSLTSIEAADSVERGILKVFTEAQIRKIPIADGGEGSVEALVAATNGSIVHTEVSDPLGRRVKSFFGVLGDGKTAVIEMASASGITLLQKVERNPMITTTYGTGELIKKALDLGYREFIIGIGGSATNDGGAGMAQALGVGLFDKAGKNIPFGGGYLKNINTIDISGLDDRIRASSFLVACDVNNTLCGPEGASAVYGPQKGADIDMIKLLDKGLLHFSQIIKNDLGIDILHTRGGGAAGGLGAGLIAFLNGKLMPGIEIIIEKTGLKKAIDNADIIVTGEGRLDEQTRFGKVPAGIGKLAQKANVPVIAIAGALADSAKLMHNEGIGAMFSIMDYPMDIEDALNSNKAKYLLESNTEEIFRTIKLFNKKE